MINLLASLTILKILTTGSMSQMAFVSEGSFKHRNNIEKYVRSFYIDIYEVTNIEYMDFHRATGHIKPFFLGNDKLNLPVQPVVGVNLEDAKQYCKWAKKRLPSEEEWEKAASFDVKKGTSYLYPWGNKWSIYRLNTLERNIGKTTIIGIYPQGKSPYGLYDMAGNVWEWTSTIYNEKIKNIKNFRYIIKGGSWGNKDNTYYARASSYGALEPQLRLSNVGFRCVK